MTFEKRVIPVPTVCVIEQVAALLPGQWDYQGGGQEELEKGGWLFGGRVGAVHHAVHHAADIKPLHRYAFEIQEA